MNIVYVLSSFVKLVCTANYTPWFSSRFPGEPGLATCSVRTWWMTGTRFLQAGCHLFCTTNGVEALNGKAE